MAEAAGEENFFLFGLTADQVAGSRGWYNPHWHYEHEPETRQALDLIFSGHFSRGAGHLRAAARHLLTHGDHYMHLADLTSYLEADHACSSSMPTEAVDAQRDPEYRQLREILQRPHHRRICRRNLGASPARCRRR